MEQNRIHLGMDVSIFLNTYYLKAELIAFCRQEGLQSTGSKEQLLTTISWYLKTQEKRTVPLTKKVKVKASLDSLIVENMVCDESLRFFFKQHIKPTFHFSVAFQKWLRDNVGKTLQDAIVAYPNLQKEKQIAKQFEYNRYIKAFYLDNPKASKALAIACWNYKKQQLGNHSYEKEDLIKVKEAVTNKK